MKIKIQVTDSEGKHVDILSAIKSLNNELGTETKKRKQRIDAAYAELADARESMGEIKPKVKTLQGLIDLARSSGMKEKLEEMGIERPALRGGKKKKTTTDETTIEV
jgi:hypothetical protein